MKIRFWGVRGSIATPGRSTLRYGGNTSCVEVRTQDGQLFILDCGTGMRELGNRLFKGHDPVRANILLSHTHWDHTQGFSFFKPLARKETDLTICASPGVDRKLSSILSMQMDYQNFPVALEEQRATLNFREIGEETFNLGDVRVRTQYVNHTVLTLGFRLAIGGSRVVYVPDHEPFSPVLYRSGVESPSLADVLHAGDRKHIDFLANADLVIHDAQYTDEEALGRRNWGHSTWLYAVDVCVAAGVKRLALFHHDPDHDDAVVERIETQAQQRARAQGSPLMVVAAEEGMTISLSEEEADARATISGPIASVSRRKQPRILVVDDEPGMVQFVKTVLAKDGYDITTANTGDEALEMARKHHPDLVLLDVLMPHMDGFAVLEKLRSTPELRETPVIMFTAKMGEEDLVRGFATGVTDFISKPAAPALLRSRVGRALLSGE